MTVKPQPFVKWIGGKRQLLSVIRQNRPNNFIRLIEPFVGGGAVLFSINRKNSFISDTNEELINTYEVLANSLQIPLLIEKLQTHETNNSEEHYISLRNMDRDDSLSSLSNVDRAARFIYLNKRGYNGLQRFNKKGHSNVAYGNMDHATSFSEENLWACHNLLSTTVIRHGDFSGVLDVAQQNDFVYFDPPYIPLPDQNSFLGYTKDRFSMDDQKRLRALMDELHKRKVFMMMSNSYCDETIALYDGYRQIAVNANRKVNINTTDRGDVQELLITNYQDNLFQFGKTDYEYLLEQT